MKTDRELIEDLSSALRALNERYSVYLHGSKAFVLGNMFDDDIDCAWIDTPGVITIVGESGYIYED